MLSLALGFGNPSEVAIIAVIVLLLFGGPSIARLGKSLGEAVTGISRCHSKLPWRKASS